MKTLTYTTILALSTVLLSCGGSSNESNATEANDTKSITFHTKELLGESLFSDKNLSLTRNTACATCHDPDHAFIDARFKAEGVDQAVFVNGAFSVGDDNISLGGRNTPTAAYAMFAPDFNATTMVGGQFHDGRAKNLKDQAGRPPLDGAEMQMPDKTSVVERLKENADYIAAFKTHYGEEIFNDINATYDAMSEAIAKFEKSDAFASFDSKYDKMLRGEYEFSREEDAGYALFFSNANTNCASCHSLNSTSEDLSGKEMFTNYKFENIGTPRNIAAMDARFKQGFQDANATFKGVGATLENSEHNGKTKVPTLRNVAVTGPYMSNGVFTKLRTVLEFYDHMAGLGHHTNPETGKAWGENDHNASINFELLRETKALDDTKIKALEAFLRTLTDERYEHLLPELAPEGEVGN
jgi:cytochrome c peroxidase